MSCYWATPYTGFLLPFFHFLFILAFFLQSFTGSLFLSCGFYFLLCFPFPPPSITSSPHSFPTPLLPLCPFQPTRRSLLPPLSSPCSATHHFWASLGPLTSYLCSPGTDQGELWLSARKYLLPVAAREVHIWQWSGWYHGLCTWLVVRHKCEQFFFYRGCQRHCISLRDNAFSSYVCIATALQYIIQVFLFKMVVRDSSSTSLFFLINL